MNQRTTAKIFLFSFLAVAVIPVSSLAEDADGPIWRVDETNIPMDENLIWVDDEMRLHKAPKDDPKHYMLKPEARLSGRWGQTASYKAKLDKSEDDPRVFCGEIVIRYGGTKIRHKLALSEIVENERVTLYFYPPGSHAELDVKDGCSYHDTHGGLAHVHNTQ